MWAGSGVAYSWLSLLLRFMLCSAVVAVASCSSIRLSDCSSDVFYFGDGLLDP